MTIAASDIRTLLTTRFGPGNSTPQASAAASLGGWASQTPWTGGTLNDLLGPVSSVDLAIQEISYRGIYVANQHLTETAFDVRVYLANDIAGACEYAIGLDPGPVSFVGQADAQGVVITADTIAPSGVSFVTPSSYASGLVIGDLLPGTGRMIWIRQSAGASADSTLPPTDGIDIIIETA